MIRVRLSTHEGRRHGLLFGSLALLLAGMVPAFASCAEAEESGKKDEDASVSVPQPDAAEASVEVEAGASDAGCDASEKGCVDHVISCDDVPWCPTATTVSSQYALTAVWGTGKNDVWAVGSGGTIAHYDGSAWKQTPTGVKNTFRAVWGSGPTDVYAVSMTDAIFHSNGFTGGTAQWTRMPSAGEDWPMTALSIWGTSADDVRIGVRARMTFDPKSGEYKWIDQYTLRRDAPDPDAGADGGADAGPTVSWEAVAGEGNVHGIWGSSPTDLWIVADNSERNGWEKGLTRHGVAGGKGGFAWTSVDSQSTVVLQAIWGSSKDDVWAVGDKGTIRRMKSGATRWEIVASPTTENLRALWGTAANDVWAVGDSGTILHFDGTSWKTSEAAFGLGLKPDLYGVWGSSANDVWIVGGNVALHYTGPKPAGQGGGK